MGKKFYDGYFCLIEEKFFLKSFGLVEEGEIFYIVRFGVFFFYKLRGAGVGICVWGYSLLGIEEVRI